MGAEREAKVGPAAADDEQMTATASEHSRELAAGDRFAFGANWSRFLRSLDADRISRAEQSLLKMLGTESLKHVRFLDAGSGSGLFSLAARRLGATVRSFDYDPESVRCTTLLKDRFCPGDPDWLIGHGSVLDRAFLRDLGCFDVVYSWGVLHHTGAMWQATREVAALVAPGGRLFVALYNDQGWKSRYWRTIKRWYCGHRTLRAPIVAVHAPFMILLPIAVRAMTGRFEAARGMSRWHDLIDWVGGYPFEVASPPAAIEFVRMLGFRVERYKTTARLGCNEFVFVRDGVQPCAES